MCWEAAHEPRRDPEAPILLLRVSVPTVTSLPLPPLPLTPSRAPAKIFFPFHSTRREGTGSTKDTSSSHLCPHEPCIFPAGSLSCHQSPPNPRQPCSQQVERLSTGPARPAPAADLLMDISHKPHLRSRDTWGVTKRTPVCAFSSLDPRDPQGGERSSLISQNRTLRLGGRGWGWHGDLPEAVQPPTSKVGNGIQAPNLTPSCLCLRTPSPRDSTVSVR